MYCQVNNEIDGGGDPVYRTLTFVSEGIVDIGGTVPGVGEPIKFTRVTPVSTAVNDFEDGVGLTAAALDAGFEQVIFGIQEAQDNLQDAEDTEAALLAAQDAQAAAEAAQTAAETAETNAETAETDAQTAQAAAEQAVVDAQAVVDGLGTEFSDDTFRIKDDVDATKKVAFELSAVSTGTVRTITLPDEDIVLGQGGIAYIDKTGTYIAKAGEGIVADTSGGAWTLTFPEGEDMDRIIVRESGGWKANNLTILPDGSETFNGHAALNCDVNDVQLEFVKKGTDWEFTMTATGGGVSDVLSAANNLSDVAAPASRGNLNKYEDKTADYDLVVGDWIYADTSGGTFNLTLPATAPNGAEIRIADPGTWADTPPILLRNGNTIKGNALDMELSTGNVEHTLRFNSVTGNWRVHTGAVSGGDFGNAAPVLLDTQVAAGASSVEFTSGIDDTYKEYLVTFISVVCSTDVSRMKLRVSNDGGTSWVSTAGDYGFRGYYGYASSANQGTPTSGYAELDMNYGFNVGAGTGESQSGFLRIYDPSNATLNKHGEWLCTGSYTDGNHGSTRGEFTIQAGQDAIDALQFFYSVGTFSGTFKLYGIQ